MRSKRLSHREVIEQLGDNAELAPALGLTSGAITRWKSRGIPPLYWPKLARLAKLRGIRLSVEDLEAASPDPKLRGCAA